MNRRTLGRALACVVAFGAVTLAPVASASASDSSIKALIKSYNGKIVTSEGKLLTAIGEYKTSRNPEHVIGALDNAIGVLRSLKAKIANQSATTTRVKKGKADLVKGLQAVIVAYGHLKVAFGEKAGSPSAARENAEKADVAVKKGRVDLAEGLKLLK
ncbi:MAG: hypothetical protein JWN10_1995 [Solirubrobacterales bacterium]|nr:hypothetical protein [Solirubrobacterales bacterium]